MNELAKHLLFAVLAGAVCFFLLYGIGLAIWWWRLDPGTRRILDMDKGVRKPLAERVTDLWEQARGTWTSELIFYMWLLGAAAGLIAGMIFGLPLVLSALLAFALGIASVAVAMVRVAAQRRRLFESQLLTAFNLMATQLEGGNGPQRAIGAITEVLDEPIRSEFVGVQMAAKRANVPIADSFRQMAKKYPVPALKSFVVALDVNAETGSGQLAPMLRSLAKGLDDEFRLRSEAEAEIAQSKYEFYAIVAIFGAMWGSAWFLGGSIFREALTDPIGIAISVVSLLNALVGVWRAQRMFAFAAGKVNA